MKNKKERKLPKKTVAQAKKFMDDLYNKYGVIMSKLAYE
jgi:hypothetical protein